jgi:EmrB/QacA subfamily drug resistance transporter
MTAVHTEHTSMRRAWTVLAAVGFTNFQMAMTLSMAFVVFPDLERDFPNASSATLSWAVNIFTIVGASTLVLGAALARRWGDKRALLAGTGLFTAASIAAALSPGVTLLIACRTGQALGSSLVIPSGAALLYREFPLAKRGLAVTSQSAVGAVGAAAGPSLGGFLINAGSWRWAFWMNLPLGLVAFVVVALVVKDTPARSTNRLPDAASSVLLTAGIGLAVLALVQSPEWGWGDPRTLAALVAGLALLVIVVRRSVHHPRPLLELALFRDAHFRVGNTALFLLSVSFFGFLLTSVLFLTNVWDYSIQRAGLLTTPVFASTAVMAVVSNRATARVGYRAVLLCGGALWAAGTLWLALDMGPTPTPGRWLLGIFTLGTGSGMLWGSMLAVSLATLPTDAMAAATSLSQTLQNIGSTIGVALMITALGTIAVGDLGRFPAVWVMSAVTTFVAAAICAGVAIDRSAPAPRPRVADESAASTS